MKESQRSPFSLAVVLLLVLTASQAADTPQRGKEGEALERDARASCDRAEMLLRSHKIKEAQAAAESFLKEAQFRHSRYRSLALYYHGFASFLLKDSLAAGRSLSLLIPFNDPLYGTHARYLLARVHHAAGERQEASAQYEGVLADHAKQKQAAAEAIKQPDRFKNDPQEKSRLERLLRDPPADHVMRAAFFLGVLKYEDGKFAEAIERLSAFRQQVPLSAEAQLRVGFCQVQLKQFAEAQKTLQPLADKEPRLADQALLWIAKAQAGAGALKTAIGSYRKAAEQVERRANDHPAAKTRRGEILLEMADTQQLAGLHKDAADNYHQILTDKLLSSRQEEVTQYLVAALHLAGAYDESDKICLRFRDAYPKSGLLPAVLFRYAENAYFRALDAGSKGDVTERGRWSDEAIRRYQAVVQKYPEFVYVNLARYGLGMIYYHKGDLDKAKETLEAIPAAERSGELALVSYQLAYILIRQAPAKADDALAAGKLEEQLKTAIELLGDFVASQPNGPHCIDALLKLGYCQRRMADLLAQPPDKAKALADAFATYQQLRQGFPNDPVAPPAVFERSKVKAQSGDINTAIKDLRRFFNDPWKNAPVAPMALLHLATLLRRQNNPQEAARILAECRRQHEHELQKDPARAAWVTLIQFHHGVALRESGKRSEAKVIFDLVAQQAAARPESAEAALRAGQCLKDDGQAKIRTAQKRLAQPNLSAKDRTSAQNMLEEGRKDVRQAVDYFTVRAEKLRQKDSAEEVRARMLYEAAWGSRILADKDARKHYLALIEAFPDLGISSEARFELAELLAESNEFDAAIKLLRDAIDKEPPAELTDKIRLRLGDCLLRKGDAKAALAQFEPIAARSGVQRGNNMVCAQAKYRAGECQLRLNAPAEAVKHLAVFRDRNPYRNMSGLTDPALLRLGDALGLLKQRDASRQAYEKVLREHPRSESAKLARKRLEELKKS